MKMLEISLLSERRGKKNVVRSILQTVRVIQKFLMISLAEQRANDEGEEEMEGEEKEVHLLIPS